MCFGVKEITFIEKFLWHITACLFNIHEAGWLFEKNLRLVTGVVRGPGCKDRILTSVWQSYKYRIYNQEYHEQLVRDLVQDALRLKTSLSSLWNGTKVELIALCLAVTSCEQGKIYIVFYYRDKAKRIMNKRKEFIDHYKNSCK